MVTSGLARGSASRANELRGQVTLSGGLRRRNEAKLLHHAHQVKKGPVFYNFALLDALDDNRAHCNLLAGWGKALKVATVDAPPGYASRDLIPLRDLVLYHDMAVTESRVEHANLLQQCLAVQGSGRAGEMHYEVGRQ